MLKLETKLVRVEIVHTGPELVEVYALFAPRAARPAMRSPSASTTPIVGSRRRR